MSPSPSSSFRLALLQCSHLPPLIVEITGDYPQVFKSLLEASLEPIHAANKPVSFTLDTYDVVEQMAYPPDDVDYDGLLITGSPSSAYEDIPWIHKLVAYVSDIIKRKPKMKLFGLCFGHQIIAMALGAKCVKNTQWEVAVTTVKLSALGKLIFNSDDLDIQQMHQDHVPDVPPGCHLLGWSSSAPNQGFVMFDDSSPPPPELGVNSPQTLQSIHILTVQGHPEFTPEIMNMLLDMREGILGEGVAADGKRRANGVHGRQHTDGRACDGVALVGRAIWGILGVA